MPDTPPNEHPEAFVNVDYDAVLERTVAIVRSVKPDVVMGYDAHERYPHPDHLLIHRLGLDVYEAAADPERFPDAGDPWQIKRLVAPMFRAQRIVTLHEAALEHGYESPFAHWIDEIDRSADDEKDLIQIPVHDTIGVSREALRAHATQIDPNGRWFALPLSLIGEVYPYEDYEVLAVRVPFAPDSDDLFAGL